MPRQPRPRIGRQIFNVIGRGNRRQNIFEEEADKERFWRSIMTECASEGITVFQLLFMNNHYHLLPETEMEPLSLALHRAETSHAVYMNKKYGRTGHLFGDRFTAFPVEPEGLKPLGRYILLNPVRARLVDSPDQWKWSTHNAYVQPGSDFPSGRAAFLGKFGGDEATAIAAYREYMKPEPRPKADDPGHRVPLAVLAAYIEREGGHRPGFLKERAQRRDVLGLRQRFIVLAESEGYTMRQIAGFLGISIPSAYYARSANRADS